MLLLYTLSRHFRDAIQQSAIRAFISPTQAAMETIPRYFRISVALQDMIKSVATPVALKTIRKRINWSDKACGS